MSIIHDALKKVEKSGRKVTLAGEQKDRPISFNIKIYGLYGIVILAGLLIGNAVFSLLSGAKEETKPPLLPVEKVKPISSNSNKPQITTGNKDNKSTVPFLGGIIPEKQAAKESAASFTVNGVFFSQKEGYALINNKVVKEGQTIDGALVKKIDLDQVDLEISGKTIRLPTQEQRF